MPICAECGHGLGDTHTSLATTMKCYAKVHRADEALGQASLMRSPTSQPVAAALQSGVG